MIPCSGLHRSQIIRNILTTNHFTNVNLHHYCRFTNKISLISANDILKFVNLSSFTLGNIWGVCVHLCTPMYAPWTYMLYVFVHIARLIEETCVCVWKYMHINRFTCTGKHTYTLSYYHHQIGVWTVSHCLGLGHETIVFAVCFFVFLYIHKCDQSFWIYILIYVFFTFKKLALNCLGNKYNRA